MKYSITQDLLPSGTKRRAGVQADPIVFAVAHDTGNPGSTARQNVTFYRNSANDTSASAHLFVDDKEILECIPAFGKQTEKAWHVLKRAVTRDNALFGCDANDAAIGVEYCYGGSINADEAYKRYVWTLAYVCFMHKLDPVTTIVGHFILDPGRKTDPRTGLHASGRSYEQLLFDVIDEYNTEFASKPQPVKNGGRARTKGKLNVRKAPSVHAKIKTTLPAGSWVNFVTAVSGDIVQGINKWYQLAEDEYVWSGGTVVKEV